MLYIQTWYGSAQECQRSHSHWEKPQAKGSETGDASSGSQNEAHACQVLERGVADDVVGVGEAELGEGGVVHQVQQGVGSDVGGGHVEDHQLLQLLHPLQAGDLIATEALEQLTKQQIGIGTGYKAVQWQWNTLQSSTVALEHITKQHSGIGTCYKTNSTVVLEHVTKQTAQWYWNMLQNKQRSSTEHVTKQTAQWHCITWTWPYDLWNKEGQQTVAILMPEVGTALYSSWIYGNFLP